MYFFFSTIIRWTIDLILHNIHNKDYRLSIWPNWKGRDKLAHAKQSSVPKGWAISPILSLFHQSYATWRPWLMEGTRHGGSCLLAMERIGGSRWYVYPPVMPHRWRSQLVEDSPSDSIVEKSSIKIYVASARRERGGSSRRARIRYCWENPSFRRLGRHESRAELRQRQRAKQQRWKKCARTWATRVSKLPIRW